MFDEVLRDDTLMNPDIFCVEESVVLDEKHDRSEDFFRSRIEILSDLDTPSSCFRSGKTREYSFLLIDDFFTSPHDIGEYSRGHYFREIELTGE